MTWEINFTEGVAIVTEDGNGLTQKGLDNLFDIFDHFCNGGTVDNFPGMTRDEIVVMLAVAWVGTRFEVLSHDES